jgi:predicted nucleotidyltransferase
MSVQRLQARLAGIVANLPDVRLVYLFGSRVHEPAGPMSDYDIAVLVARDADEGPILAQLGHELARALGTDRIDVVSLRRAPIELAYAIIARGEVLYQRAASTSATASSPWKTPANPLSITPPALPWRPSWRRNRR